MAVLIAIVADAPPTPSQAAELGQDVKSRALLAKHRSYVGWHFSDGTFRTMRIRGGVTDEKGKQTGSFVLPSSGIAFDNTYTAVDRDGISEHDGFTGW